MALGELVRRAFRAFRRAPGAPARESVEGDVETRDGQVGVREGRAFVTDPAGDGDLAALVAGPGVVLEVNGQRVSASALRSTDDVRIRPEVPEEYEPPRYEVSVAQDGLAAMLTVTPGLRVTRAIRDHPPAPRVVLDLEERREVLPPDPGEALQVLSAAGVTRGIDRDALEGIAAVEAMSTLVVARGSAPRPGADFAFEPASEEIARGAKDRRGVPVPAGRFLGLLSPARPSEPGYTVTGAELAPVQPAATPYRIGPGIRAEGGRLYAGVDGRFVIREEGGARVFAVQPLSMFTGDLEGRTIEVDGDLLVRGTCVEVRAVARGSLILEGAAANCHLAAHGDLLLQGSATRSLLAAGPSADALRAQRELEALKRAVDYVLRSYAEIRMSGVVEEADWAVRGPRAIVRTALKTRLREVPDELERLSLVARNVGGAVADILVELDRLFRGEEPVHVEELQRLARRLEDRQAEARRAEPGPAHLSVYAAAHSEIFCDGDVVLAKGCESTRVVASGTVACGASVRGGAVWALGDVFARTIGSPYETETRVTSVRGRVWAEYIHPGVTLEVGDAVVVNDAPRRECCAVEEDGRVRFVPARATAAIEDRLHPLAAR
ncbi:MAG: DUF342 domain-containing protein [Clostridia bacterium]|nr:DUF342 domain-containing protein [Clostridia bacterium]